MVFFIYFQYSKHYIRLNILWIAYENSSNAEYIRKGFIYLIRYENNKRDLGNV